MGAYDTLMASLTPIARWKFADTSGSSTAADSTGNNETLNAVGTVTFGSAVLFPGTGLTTVALAGGANGFQRVPFGSPYSNLTVLCWVNTTDGTDQMNLYSLSAGGNANGLVDVIFNLVAGDVRFEVFAGGSGGSTEFAPAFHDGNWHMLTLSYNGTTRVSSCYFDTTLLGTLGPNGSTISFSGTDTFSFGGFGAGGSHAIKGNMAEGAMFNSALTGSQVAALYNAAFTFAASGSITGSFTANASATVVQPASGSVVASFTGSATAIVDVPASGSIQGSFLAAASGVGVVVPASGEVVGSFVMSGDAHIPIPEPDFTVFGTSYTRNVLGTTYTRSVAGNP